MVKVERSFPAPESLAVEARKENGSYNKKDVTERLKKDFNDKCYICELKGLQDPEVEHLLPHKNGKYPERKFDWNNLFWCCGHCNGIKNKGKYDNGIIDCCRQDPEKQLFFSIDGDDIKVLPIDEADRIAALTAELIYETFNQKNSGIRVAACYNRMQGLKRAMNILLNNLEAYKKTPDSRRNIQVMRVLLSRDSEFAAFKRGYVRARLAEYPELTEFVE